MFPVKENLHLVLDTLPQQVRLVAISKYHPAEYIMAAYEEGQALMASLNTQYDAIIGWSELYDGASIETKKMIVNCLRKRIDVYRGYRVHIDFNIDFEQFQFGLDLKAKTA